MFGDEALPAEGTSLERSGFAEQAVAKAQLSGDQRKPLEEAACGGGKEEWRTVEPASPRLRCGSGSLLPRSYM